MTTTTTPPYFQPIEDVSTAYEISLEILRNWPNKCLKAYGAREVRPWRCRKSFRLRSYATINRLVSRVIEGFQADVG